MYLCHSATADDNGDVTDHVQAVCIKHLGFIWFPGRHSDIPSLKLCPHLCRAEEDCWVTMAMVNQLHQMLLIVSPDRIDGWRWFR